MKREKPLEAYIYCIEVLPCGPCKIGYAANPWLRFRQIEVGNHCDLRLAYVVKVGPERVCAWEERKLHRLFMERWVRGEWFSVSAEEVAAAMAGLGEVLKEPPEPEVERKLMAVEELEKIVRLHPRDRMVIQAPMAIEAGDEIEMSLPEGVKYRPGLKPPPGWKPGLKVRLR